MPWNRFEIRMIFVVMMTIWVFSGCGRRIRISGSRVTQPGVLTTWFHSLKPRRGRFDAVMLVENHTDGPLVVMSQDVSCGQGTVQGTLAKRPFHKPGIPVVIAPGRVRKYGIVCRLNGGQGEFFVHVARVAQQDPETKSAGALVLENVVIMTDINGRMRGSVGQAFETTVAAAPPPPVAPPPTSSPPVVEPPVSKPPVATVSPLLKNKPPAVNHPDWIIAIMDVEDVNATSRKKAIDPDLIRNIADQLRIFVAERGVRTIDKSAQQEAFKDSLAQMKSESYKACYDDSCQIELGKALAATHILRTKITRFGSKCVLNGELIDLRSEVAVTAATSKGNCVAEGFLGMCEEVAVSLTSR